MIVNIRAQFTSRTQNVAKGIQKWLYEKGYCRSTRTIDVVDADLYKGLLYEFARAQPNFDETRIIGLESIEGYVDRRFKQFCIFVTNKFDKK